MHFTRHLICPETFPHELAARGGGSRGGAVPLDARGQRRRRLPAEPRQAGDHAGGGDVAALVAAGLGVAHSGRTAGARLPRTQHGHCAGDDYRAPRRSRPAADRRAGRGGSPSGSRVAACRIPRRHRRHRVVGQFIRLDARLRGAGEPARLHAGSARAPRAACQAAVHAAAPLGSAHSGRMVGNRHSPPAGAVASLGSRVPRRARAVAADDTLALAVAVPDRAVCPFVRAGTRGDLGSSGRPRDQRHSAPVVLNARTRRPNDDAAAGGHRNRRRGGRLRHAVVAAHGGVRRRVGLS